MKTFSFIDCDNQDFVKYTNGHTVRIKAEDHGHAQQVMFEDGLCDDTDWTNTGVKTWCWEDME